MATMFLTQADGTGPVSRRRHVCQWGPNAQPGFLLLLAPSFKSTQSTLQRTARLTSAPPVHSGWRENMQLFVLSESPHTPHCLGSQILIRFSQPSPGPHYYFQALTARLLTLRERGEVMCPRFFSSGAEQPAFRACLLSVFQRC